MLQTLPIAEGETAGPCLAPKRALPPALGQIVLVLQGGGALGAYQAGVYQALHEAGVEPNWVIGTKVENVRIRKPRTSSTDV